MKLNLLLSAAAVACLAWPAASFADPPSDQTPAAADQGKDNQDHQAKGKANGQANGNRVGQAGRGAAPSANVAARDVSASAPNARASRDRALLQQTPQVAHPAQARAADFSKAPFAPRTQPDQAVQSGATEAPLQGGTGAGVFQPQAGQPGSGQRQSNARRAIQPSTNQTALARWSPGVGGLARAQAVQQWRQSNSGWDNRTPWRSNTNWWRDNSAFSQFAGVRSGFFFIPGQGYVSAPAEYRSRRWQSGETLPSWFWGYAVRDYLSYGLPRPPDGCGWVWVNDDVALIDLSDGYILDIEHNVW